jgi:hypothetical protein
VRFDYLEERFQIVPVKSLSSLLRANIREYSGGTRKAVDRLEQQHRGIRDLEGKFGHDTVLRFPVYCQISETLSVVRNLERSLASVTSVIFSFFQMCPVENMMRHIAIAALFAVLASGAPRSSIIYADDKMVSDVILLFIYYVSKSLSPKQDIFSLLAIKIRSFS